MAGSQQHQTLINNLSQYKPSSTSNVVADLKNIARDNGYILELRVTGTVGASLSTKVENLSVGVGLPIYSYDIGRGAETSLNALSVEGKVTQGAFAGQITYGASGLQ